jgi:hypothetical protein
MRHSALVTLLAACAIAGCQTVHTERDGDIPIAVWDTAPVKEEHPEPSQLALTVARVLKDAGLHADVDGGGVAVPADVARRAREALLTDQRLSGSRVFILLTLRAGTGRKTDTGFELPAAALDEPEPRRAQPARPGGAGE